LRASRARQTQARVRDEYRRWNFADDLIEHIIDGLRKAGLDIPEELATNE
jgi:hypothetical protein